MSLTEKLEDRGQTQNDTPTSDAAVTSAGAGGASSSSAGSGAGDEGGGGGDASGGGGEGGSSSDGGSGGIGGHGGSGGGSSASGGTGPSTTLYISEFFGSAAVVYPPSTAIDHVLIPPSASWNNGPLALSPSGLRLAMVSSSGSAGVISFWSSVNDTLSFGKLLGQQSPCWDADFSNDENRVYVVELSKLRYVDITTTQQGEVNTSQYNLPAMSSIEMVRTPNSTKAYVLGWWNVGIFDTSTGTMLGAIPSKIAMEGQMAIANGGLLYVPVGAGTAAGPFLRAYDTTTDLMVWEASLNEHIHGVYPVPGGSELLLIGNSGDVALFDIAQKKVTKVISSGFTAQRIAFANNGDAYVTSSSDGMVRVFDSTNWTLQPSKKINLGSTTSFGIAILE